MTEMKMCGQLSCIKKLVSETGNSNLYNHSFIFQKESQYTFNFYWGLDIFSVQKKINKTAEFLCFDKRILILIFCFLESSTSMVSCPLQKYKIPKLSPKLKIREKVLSYTPKVGRQSHTHHCVPFPVQLQPHRRQAQQCQTVRDTLEMNLKTKLF